MDHLDARTGEARERQLHRGGLNSRRNTTGNLREDIIALMPTPNTLDHLPARSPEKIAESKLRTPGGYSNVRETVVNDLFPTPITSDYKNGKSSAGYGLNLPETAKTLMPTPTTRDYKDGSQPHQRDGKVQTDTVARAVFNSGEINLPTPTASDWKGANHSGSGSASSRGISTVTENLLKTPIAKEGLNGNTQTTSIKKGQLWLSNDVQDISLGNGLREPDRNINLGDYHEIQWGKFEPAIRRWESIIGRPAPEPTKPDGRDNAHRLSSKFTEWMMGLPDGWITDIGLKRNDELKACGNGVVPQQAELALNLLGIKEILERN
jgi:DNA (cytosine-5)-methyltransferase 1